MRRRGLALGALIGIVALVVVAAVVVGLGREESNPSSLRLPQEIVGPDPLAFEKGRTTAYARAAAFGLSHALFAKSPGGVAESARYALPFDLTLRGAVVYAQAFVADPQGPVFGLAFSAGARLTFGD